MARNFMGHFLEITIDEARVCRSVLSDSYGRLVDFVCKLTADENDCLNVELLGPNETICSTRLTTLILQCPSMNMLNQVD